MSIASSEDVIRRLPSLRTLYVFRAAAQHRNLVRAAADLGLTQGALSRQIRSLEDALDITLFDRTPRGLRLTEAGDLLYQHCDRAFREINDALTSVSTVRIRQTLLIAVARSYATRNLAKRVASFVVRHPELDLIIDGHRHLADLERNEADAAIRVGDGNWAGLESYKIEDDYLIPVASRSLLSSSAEIDLVELATKFPLLHYSERPYWAQWAEHACVTLPSNAKAIKFTESVMMIEAAEAAQGLAIVRHSLVKDALREGSLVCLSERTLDDGIAYYFCATPSAHRKKRVQYFRDWLIER